MSQNLFKVLDLCASKQTFIPGVSLTRKAQRRYTMVRNRCRHSSCLTLVSHMHSIMILVVYNTGIIILLMSEERFKECKHFRDTESVSNDAMHMNNRLLTYRILINGKPYVELYGLM